MSQGVVVLADVRIPDEFISADMAGSLSRENDRTGSPAGFQSINAVRDITLRSWQVGVIPMLASEWEQIETVYEVSDAGALGVLLRDPKDSVIGQSQGKMQGYMSGVEFGAVGYGNGCPTYGFRKLYATGSQSRSRIITRPVAASSVCYRGSTPVVVGAAAGNVGFSAGPCYATFVPDATRTISGVTVGATTQVTLASAIGVIVGGRLWLQGLTGAHAALLNNQSHQVTAVAGAVYTLAVNTTGKTITAAGQAHKYPQPDETLTWSGIYDMPVHFRDDSIDWRTVAAQDSDGELLLTGVGIYLDEIREA